MIRFRLTLKQAGAGLLVLGALATTGCKENPRKEATMARQAAGDSAATAAATSFFEALPSPLHVARVFRRSGLKYVENAGSNPANAGEYVSQTGRALALGVYSTDLAYASLNSQNQASVNYFKAVRQVADKLNLASMIDAYNMLQRFEDNMNNQDSLVRLIADMHMESDQLLKTTNRHEVLFLSFAGGLSESLYLATLHLKSNYSQELADRMLEQTGVMAKLIDLLEAQPNRTEYKFLIDGLKDIHTELVALQGIDKNTDLKGFQAQAMKELPAKAAKLRQQVLDTK